MEIDRTKGGSALAAAMTYNLIKDSLKEISTSSGVPYKKLRKEYLEMLESSGHPILNEVLGKLARKYQVEL